METPGSRRDWVLRCGFVVACFAAGACPLAAELDWFGRAHQRHVEFEVVSRSFEPTLDGRSPRAFVLLGTIPAGELVNADRIILPDHDLKAAVVTALFDRGFRAAESAHEAEIAIVIKYGRGEYPPPFKFMGIEPTVPSFRWPRVLQRYFQDYTRLDYSQVNESGLIQQRDGTEAERFNLIMVRAFDALELRRRGNWVLRWESRVTVPALKRPLEAYFKAMTLAAGEGFGRDLREGTTLKTTVREGEVQVGPLKVLPETTGSVSRDP